MADIKLVIKMDVDVYTRLFDNGTETSPDDRRAIETAIRNGTPLPEHHGRLIDADALEQEMIIAEGKAEGNCDYYMSDTIDRAKEYIIDAETIIPATEEGEDKECRN